MRLAIPPSPTGQDPKFQTITEAILESDQFDDWLPDPVFFQDRRSELSTATVELSDLWQQREISSDGAVRLELPRSSGDTTPAVALPFNLRCIAQAVIADFAPRIQPKLIRDKVLGFGLASGDDKRLFDEPVSGLWDLGAQVVNAALVSGSNQIRIVDVSRFLASARSSTLAGILTSIGVDPRQVRFLQHVMDLGAAGLPSIDDAFGFVYNYYLKPVDDTLAQQRVNFFRYRDEYFVLSDEDVERVALALTAHGLEGHLAGPAVEIPADQLELKAQLEERWVEQQERMDPSEIGTISEDLGQLGSGWIVAEYSCDTMSEEINRCQTDYFEISFRLNPERVTARFFEQCASGQILDAIEAIPVLGAYNRIRNVGIPFIPPYDTTPLDHQDLSQRLSERASALRRAFGESAGNEKSTWQVGWVADLISETGFLSAADEQLLRSAIGTRIPAEAEWRIRTCLARCSRLAADAVWDAPSGSASPFVRRASALAAYYLAKRGHAAPWNALQSNSEPRDSVLLSWLGGNL